MEMMDISIKDINSNTDVDRNDNINDDDDNRDYKNAKESN